LPKPLALGFYSVFVYASSLQRDLDYTHSL
jgi:hypothetical protein